MTELFNSHKQLNIKKISIAVFIILFLIILLFDLFSNLFKEETTTIQERTQEAQNPNTIFYNNDKTISIELSKQYELSQYTSSNNYLLELRSPNNLDIFISKIDLVDGKTLKEVASADSNSYIENFKTYSNLSSLSEFDINNTTAYTYSFHYLDSSNKTPFYLQIIWLQTENYYYIFDVEFPVEDMENYTKIVNEILTSFREL